MRKYRLTFFACYIGCFVLAAVINITPILFIPLKEQFGFSFAQLGLLVLVNFMTQVVVDLSFSKAVDKYGFRIFVVCAHVVVALGFILFAASKTYTGFLLSTIVFSIGGGLLELLLSPIVDSLPAESKSSTMSFFHSFYSWGHIIVVLGTTLLVYVLGAENWFVIPLVWCIVPFINIFIFIKAKLAPPKHEGNLIGARKIMFKPFFIVAFIAIFTGAASEQIIAQWASTFLEFGLNINKTIGDITGVCTFALAMALGRLLYGVYGKKIDVAKMMLAGSVLALVCYVMLAVLRIDSLSVIVCALSGFGVSLLWPGTLAITSKKYPRAGAWLFAILAAGGDIGASIGPWLMSVVADGSARLDMVAGLAQRLSITPEQLGLRLGILVSAVFPLIACICIVWLYRKRKKERQQALHGDTV